MNAKISPSILAADMACLADEVARAEEGGCDTFHIDIMDGHFVPNLSYGPGIVRTMRGLTGRPLDVHLMIDNPLSFVDAFADAGSDYLTVHVEVGEADEALARIADRGVRPGLSLKPDTPVDTLDPYLDTLSLVLVMSVYPGFGGQSFIEDAYERIRWVASRAARRNPELIISVDGGVGPANARQLVESGANHLVAGTAVFRDHGAVENIGALRSLIAGRD